MINVWHDEALAAKVIALAKDKKSAQQIAQEVRLTRNQVIGFLFRRGVKLCGEHTNQHHPDRVLNNGSKGVIERLVMDKSRVTLKHIPSIAQWQESVDYAFTDPYIYSSSDISVNDQERA
jgi:hypothetical protein